jgi:hypothetical protein
VFCGAGAPDLPVDGRVAGEGAGGVHDGDPAQPTRADGRLQRRRRRRQRADRQRHRLQPLLTTCLLATVSIFQRHGRIYPSNFIVFQARSKYVFYIYRGLTL